MATSIVTLPILEPLTVRDAREHLNITHQEDDRLLSGYIVAARSAVERETHRALLTQEWDITWPRFPNVCDDGDTYIRVPGGFCQSVDSIAYVDTAGESVTLDAAEYQVDTSNEQGAVVLPAPQGTWPATQAGRRSAVTLRVTVGWPTVSRIPPILLQAVRFLIGHYYENREAVVTGTVATEMPQGAKSILQSWRVWGAV
ncbi:MAG: head-tail connector protein [Pseudomonadota bacterium]